VVKKGGAPLSEAEARVNTALGELSTNASLSAPLAKLHVVGAREVTTKDGARAVVLIVPFTQLADFKKIHTQLTNELEKKLLATTIIVANRTMVSEAAWSRGKKFAGVRPRSRTLKAVQEALLDDVSYPTEIVGKRTRVAVDGSRKLRVLLNPKDSITAEGKLAVFGEVYKTLTGKDASFTFP
jgi:small subunit ribosomal protein S7e